MSIKRKVFLGIITARGGSKGIPKKNIKKLGGIPLIEYTFDAVKESIFMDRCIVSTDDDEIIHFSKKKNMEVLFKRPKELATDNALTIDVLIHSLNYLNEKENYIPDYIITLQPTSPLRTGNDIDNAIALINSNMKADSLLSVVEVPHLFIPNLIMKYNGNFLNQYIEGKRPSRRQGFNNFYASNGAAIYISHYDLLLKQRKIIGDNCLAYIMPKERSIDIDDFFDWEIAEFIIKKRSKLS